MKIVHPLSVLRADLSRQLRVQESIEHRIGTEAELASHQGNAFRAVRELAEGAQRKAESTEDEILALRGARAGWNSAIVPDFPKLFEDFKRRKFTLLWSGSRDGFRARHFHRRCDRHPNTLTVILGTKGNVSGGFTPVFLIAMKIVHPLTKSNSELGYPLQKKQFTIRVFVLFEILR